MKWTDKLWMMSNKKPTGKLTAYFYIAFPWSVCGILWTGAVIGIAGVINAKVFSTTTFTAFIAILILAVSYTVVIFLVDRKQGYLDAIHKHCLQYRQEKLARITKIKEEVQ